MIFVLQWVSIIINLGCCAYLVMNIAKVGRMRRRLDDELKSLVAAKGECIAAAEAMQVVITKLRAAEFTNVVPFHRKQ